MIFGGSIAILIIAGSMFFIRKLWNNKTDIKEN